MDKPLFENDESDNEVTFKSNSEYAKKYNTLRRNEELLKLKNKYGTDAVLSEDPSSSEDDDDKVIFTEEFERDFFKTLSCLKKKDPRIYDQNVRFFEKESVPNGTTGPKKKSDKEKPITIRDYNRKIILEKDGKFSDDEETNEEDNTERPASPSYVQEQQQIKKLFSSAINEDEDESEEIGGLFSKKIKSKQEEEEEEKGYRDWIAGQVTHLTNDSDEKDLKPLKDFWSNPLLEKDEAFLRDYFLNQRFKETSDNNRIPSYDEIVKDTDEEFSEDEKLVGEQAEFEHKFNFRFEEPDQDFIKRYPRTLEHSLRRKDDKRAKKRAEVKDRKVDEKKRKKEAIAQLKAHKLKEIKEKIEKLKEITGNDQLAFNDEDIEGDFDPDAHDRRMKELFDGDYYDGEDNMKPKFPGMDDELGLDDWVTWDTDETEPKPSTSAGELHCEDEDFNMDCEYDPNAANKTTLLNDLKEATENKRKRRKKKGKLVEALETKKPTLDSQSEQTYTQYLDEYYKLDCEDVIGDMPCRFKYREVPALDYGLTTAEIFMADDDELNQWYPLKKTLEFGQEHRQKNDQKILEAKARNLQLKMKILPSLFKPQNDDEDPSAPKEVSATKRKRNKKKRKKDKNHPSENVASTSQRQQGGNENSKKQKDEASGQTSERLSKSERKKNKNSLLQIGNSVTENGANKRNKKSSVKTEPLKSDSREITETSLNSEAIVQISEVEKKKRKRNKKKMEITETPLNSEAIVQIPEVEKKKRKRNKKKLEPDTVNSTAGTPQEESKEIVCKKRKSVKQDTAADVEDSSPKKKKKKHQDNVELNNSQQSVKKNKSKKQKFNKPENFQNAQEVRKADPMSTLSDGRLKAYGLNPKKYKNFMKFKKY